MGLTGTPQDQTILMLYSSAQARAGHVLLVEQYQKPLLRLFENWLGPGCTVRGRDAEDLREDTLLLVHARLESGEPVESLPALIYLYARSIFQRNVRPSRDALEHASPSEDDLPHCEAPAPGVDSLLEKQRLQEAFRACLQGISNERYRSALQFNLLGETLSEVALRLGWKGFEGAASAIRSAQRQVWDCLRQKGYDVDPEYRGGIR